MGDIDLRAKRAPISSVAGSVAYGGVAVSANSGSFNTGSLGYVSVLSCDLNSTGRACRVQLQGDLSGVIFDPSFLGIQGAGFVEAYVSIIRNGVRITEERIFASGLLFLPCSMFGFVDYGTVGYVGNVSYLLQVKVGGSGGAGIVAVHRARLVAHEIN